MKRFLLCVFISGFIILSGFSEEDSSNPTSRKSALLPLELNPGSSEGATFEETLHQRLLLSMSTDDYLVTPGDVYRLTYLSSNELISYEVVLESDFNLNLNVFGKINAENLTFTALKKLVEEKIASAYPDSTPSMTILSNGIFQVYIRGEVSRAGYITAWGLTRLSHILEDYLTPYSSIRDIEIISRDGNSRKYDLFKAQRFGKREEDPRLRPNDIIEISKIERTVQLEGEVRRPGEYQLLPGQELAELLGYYGDGFTQLADMAGIRIERVVTDSSKAAETLYVSFDGSHSTFTLNDLDIVTVPTKIEKLPVIYFEGAFRAEGNTGGNNELDTRLDQASGKITYRLKEGETLYNVLANKKELISPNAKLDSAFIERKDEGQLIPVNLEKLLFDYDPTDDMELEPYDHIVIPFRQSFVTVTGAVHSPGRYNYVPEKSYKYYLDLAGGIDPEKSTSKKVDVIDLYDGSRGTEAIIQPEDRINVPYSFSYYFTRYFPLVASGVTVLILVLDAFGVVQTN